MREGARWGPTAVIAVVLAGGLASTAQASPAAGSAPDPSRFTASAVTAVESQFDAAKSASGKVAQSDPALLKRTDDALVAVMVKLDLDPVASYTGGVKGLKATSPAATKKPLKANKAAVAAYTKHANAVVASAAKDIRKAVPAAKVGRSFTTAFGGVAVRLPANKAKDLLAVDGVVAVQSDTLEQLQTDSSPRFVGATNVWPSLGGSSTAGEGVLVGILDSGIWPEHPSLADPGIDPPDGGPFACEFGDGSAGLGDEFACNDKLVGAHVFLDTYLAATGAVPGEYCNANGCSARDADGHGTHTATTAAGSPVASATVLGVDRGAVSGHGARCLGHRLPRLPGPGLLQLGLRGCGAAGDHRRRRRHQLLDQGAPTPTPTRWSCPSSTPLRQASASTPRPATTARARPPRTTVVRG